MIKDFYRQNASLMICLVQLSAYEVNFFELRPRQKILRSDKYPSTLVNTQTSLEKISINRKRLKPHMPTAAHSNPDLSTIGF